MAVTESVSQYECVEAHINSKLTDLHTSMPGIVQSYDHTKNTLVVTPVFYRTLVDGDDNEIPGEPLPDLQDVPIEWPSGGDYILVFPIQKGDEVVLIFSERNIGAWRSNGSAGDPGDLAMHPLDGAIARAGCFSNQRIPATADGSNTILGHKSDATKQITIGSGGVTIGAGVGGGDAAVTATDIANIKLAIVAGVPIPTDGGAGLKASILAAWPTLVGSTKVKVGR